MGRRKESSTVLSQCTRVDLRFHGPFILKRLTGPLFTLPIYLYHRRDEVNSKLLINNYSIVQCSIL